MICYLRFTVFLNVVWQLYYGEVVKISLLRQVLS